MARQDGIQTNWNFNITVSGAELVTASLNTIQKAAKNIDLSKYWISQEQMIENLTKAIEEYNNALAWGDRGALGSAATEVVNLGRALQTLSGDKYGNIIETMGLENLDSIIAQARKSAEGMVFSAKELEEAFSFFSNMEKYDLDVQSVMRSIGDSGEIDRLQNELSQLQEDYNDAQDSVDRWRDRYYSSMESARQETERLNAEIERLKSDFANTDNGILVQQLNDLQAELDETKEKLASANDTDFKLDNIDTQIKEVIDKLDNLWDKLKNGDFTSGVDGTFSPIANLLNGLSAGVEAAGITIDQANSKILELANSLKTLQSSLDLTSIVTLNNLLKTIQSLETLKVNSTGIKNFKLLMDQIANYKDASVAIGQLKQISEIDWSKLNALVVPKGSADFFTAISKVKNADEVKKLSKADFSKWSTFKVSKQAFVDNITTFIKLINSQTTDIDKFKQLTALDFSNFNNIKFDKNSLNAMSQLLSSLTVAERLDNLERRLTGGGGGGGGNVPSGPNLVPPDTELDVLGKAMAGVGATDADIERVVGRFTELGLRAQSARAAVAEIGEEGEKLYNIVATTTDEFGNTVSHLIQYSDATQDVSINLGNAANRLKELSEADLSKSLKTVLDQLGGREDLAGTKTGQGMQNYALELNAALEAVQNGLMSANDAVNQFVTGGRAGFENLTNVVNQFKLEASQTAKPIEDAAMSETQRADAISRLNAQLNTIQANEQKWSAAKASDNASSVAAFEIYQRQAQALEELKTKVQSASISQEEYAASVATIKSEMAECERIIRQNGDAYDKEKNILVNGSSAQAKAIKQVSLAYEEAQRNLEKWKSLENDQQLGGAYAQYKNAAEGLNALCAQLATGTMSAEEFRLKWATLSREMASSKSEIDASGRSFDTLSDKISKVVQRFSSLFSTVRVFNAVKRVMREMVQNVRDLDSSFAQLRIVTGATDAEMEKFAAVASDLAKNLGQSVTDVTKSIEVFSRLGYSLSDATDLSKFATIMANVGDVTTDAATTGLTAIIKGFEMEASDAEHVSDVLVNVGQKYAISAEELMTAFEKSGAALHATNTEFEKSVALYAAANASIQNANTVGTALKTLSARIRGSKTDLEELGEGYDDLADGFSKYAEEVKALTGFDIRVEGTTNTYKDLYDIMEGLSKVWGNLSDAAQARTAEILGGTRQLQVIASIISNWDDAAGAYETAMNSMGVATQANEIYMDTLEAKIQQFKSTFQDFSYTVLNSDLLKFGVDAGAAILNTLNNIVKSAGSLLPILTAISGIVIMRNFGDIAQLIGKIPTAITGVINSFRMFDGSFFAAATTVEKFTMGIGAALAVYGTAASIYNSVRQQERAEWEQSVETAKQRMEELKTVEELEGKYRFAQKAYEDGKISKDAYKAATEELASALGLEANEIGNLENKLSDYKKLSRNMFASSYMDAQKMLDDAANMTFWERLFSPIKAPKYAVHSTRLNSILGLDNVDLSSADGILETYDKIVAKMDEMAESSDNIDELVKDKDYQTLKFFADLLGDAVEGYRDYYDAMRDATDGSHSFLSNIEDINVELSDSADVLEDTAAAVHEATGEWGEYGEALMAASDAQSELDKLIEGGDWNEGFENRTKAFEKFKELLESGMLGSREFAAYKDFFGLSGMNSEQVGQWISNNEKYFQEGVDSVTAFFDTVASKSDELKDIATWDESTGVFWYDSTKLTEFADAMGWTEEQLVDMLGNARMYFEDWETHSPAEAFKEFADAGLFTDFNGQLITSLEQLRQFTGEDDEAIQSLITSINTLRNNQGLETIKLIDDDQIVITQQTIDNMLAAGETASEITQKIAELSQNSNVEIEPDVHLGPDRLQEVVDRVNSELEAAQNQVAVDIKLNINDEEVTVSLDATKSELESIVGPEWETILSADNTDAKSKAEATENLLNHIDQDRPVAINANGNPAFNVIHTVKGLLNSIHDKTVNISVNYSHHVGTFAKGTKNANSGMALLGDEYSPSGSPKPELVVSNGYAYLAGQHGPEIGYLRSGDVVYNASDTKKILGGAGLNGLIGAFSGGSTFSGGNAPSGYSSSSSNNSSKSKNNNSSSSSSNSSSSSSRNSSSKSSSSKEESEFEKLYKAHQHLRAMDQEETEYYLNWLNKAYKEAYKKNEIELEDYYKYQITWYTCIEICMITPL